MTRLQGVNPTGAVAVQALTEAAQGLLFPSETDAPIEPFFWPMATVEAPSVGAPSVGTPSVEAPSVEWVAAQLKVAATTVKTRSLASFFKPAVTEAEWQNEAEKAEAKRFQQLLSAVKTSLAGAKAFRVGQTEIEVYVVGGVADGYAGFKTKVVET